MNDTDKCCATPFHELEMGPGTRPKIISVATDDTLDAVGLGRCTAIKFGKMKGSMDFMPTIQVWNGQELAAEFPAERATRIDYATD